jgi:flagellar motor switch protein FliM
VAGADAAQPGPRAAETARPFPHRLGLTLTARLLQQEMPLGRLLDLRPGEVLPVRLGATDVLIDDARLFTATVAERQGKLCLTSFKTRVTEPMNANDKLEMDPLLGGPDLIDLDTPRWRRPPPRPSRAATCRR